jgi:hypothetical protein
VKVLFLPISIAAGLGAGQLARKVFDFVWTRFDDEEAPHPKYREIDLVKLIPALVIEGAIFRLVKGMTDHGLRRGFARVTGSWPGDERPEAV